MLNTRHVLIKTNHLLPEDGTHIAVLMDGETIAPEGVMYMGTLKEIRQRAAAAATKYGCKVIEKI